jgi:hypothetical protein
MILFLLNMNWMYFARQIIDYLLNLSYKIAFLKH